MAKKRNRSVSSTKVVGFSPKKDINEETSVNILSQDTSVAIKLLKNSIYIPHY